MKYILLLILSLPSITYAKRYICSYEKNGKDYPVKVYTQRKSTRVIVYTERSKERFHNCSYIRDDFGKLFDCSSHKLDLMILIGKDKGIESGGIMSSTLDLFLDLKC